MYGQEGQISWDKGCGIDLGLRNMIWVVSYGTPSEQ